MRNETRDVSTGCWTGFPHTKVGKEYHEGEENWWLVSRYSYDDVDIDGQPDGTYYEVCLFNVGLYGSCPTWPILRVAEDQTAAWMKKLMAFAKTLDPNIYDYDPTVNGNRRLGIWLTEHGFTRNDHISWSLNNG